MISTPFLASLLETRRATKLTQSYSTHRCSPTRAALLTGRYPFRYGLGSDPMSKTLPTGLDLSEKLLPHFLKENGYKTYAYGKWHLGFGNSSYLPESRGFDSFYGFYGCQTDYFTHEVNMNPVLKKKTSNYFIGSNLNEAKKGKYITTDLADQVIEQIKSDQASNSPYFSYVAFNAPHEPISAPERTINYIKRMYEERYPGRELNRGFLEYQSAIYVMDQAGVFKLMLRSYCNALESVSKWLPSFRCSPLTNQRTSKNHQSENPSQSIKRMFEVLKRRRETIVIFMGDNGAAIHSGDSNDLTDEDFDDEIDQSNENTKVYQKRGCNFPYRGKKSTFLEGGTLSPTIVWSSSSKRLFPKITNTNLVHIVDWFPTILKLTGVNSITSAKPLDGVNQIESIFERKKVWRKRKKEVYQAREGFIYGIRHIYKNNGKKKIELTVTDQAGSGETYDRVNL